MTTYDYTRGGPTGMNAHRGSKNFVIERFIDMAAIAAARLATTPAGAVITTNDVLQALAIPAYTHVIAVFALVSTVDGGTMTADIGDGTDTDGYIDNFDMNATTLGSSLITTAFSWATAGGKAYTANDTIDVLFNNATPDTGSFHIWAECIAFPIEETKGT